MLTNGQQIGRFTIISALGAGGMGEVYLAEDTKLDRKVALKILPSEFANDADRMNRFVREAKSASALNHPNIITIYEIDAEGDTHYIATEFIDGETLHDRLKETNLSLKSALDIAIQIVSALQAAHSANIIHRDIKPENVMIRADGLVKILDFGIAKLSENKIESTDAEAATAIKPPSTSPGMIIGTASYMSPEQARGKEIDARSDIFSFGIVLYEMLSGKRAFGGDTPLEIISSILKDEPPPLRQTLPDIPPEIERIAGKTLRKDADERYQTARDLLTDLKDAKQELEFRDKLDRTAAPHREEEPKTQLLTAAPTNEPRPPTSSAEFLTGEIKKHKRDVAVGLLVLLSAAIGLGYWFFGNRTASNKQIESIAVMPFVNESGNADVEYLSDGMTETLISNLSQLPNLNVKSRSSVFRYKGKETSPQTIGKELNVQAILNGRVVQRGDQLTLSLELIDAQTENVIWSEQYNRKQADLVNLQSEIARDVLGKLKTKLSGEDAQKLAKIYTTNPEAYKLYLQGRFYWNKREEKDFRKAVEYYNQAIALDPNYALAHAGLADTYALLSSFGFMPSSEAIPKAREFARRAMSLDNSLAEPHATLGYTLIQYDYDFVGAEGELKRAIEMNPNYAMAHQWYGELLSQVGRFDEALAEYRRALEIEPLSLPVNWEFSRFLYLSRRYDESFAQHQKTIELDPGFARAYRTLAELYRIKKDYANAIEAQAKFSELRGDAPKAAQLREAFTKDGWNGYLRLVTAENSPLKENNWNWALAKAYVQLGEKDKAFAELNKAYENRISSVVFFKVEPQLDPLRDDPRFEELLRKIGFP